MSHYFTQFALHVNVNKIRIIATSIIIHFDHSLLIIVQGTSLVATRRLHEHRQLHGGKRIE